MATYPQLTFELTNGDGGTKNISFTNPKLPVVEDDVIGVGNDLGQHLDGGYDFVQAHLISDSIVATND